MSWWDPSGITNLASQALKNAQKKIDKVLDIEAEEAAAKGIKQKQKENKEKTVEHEENSLTKPTDGDFWSSWLSSGDKNAKEEIETSVHSSWSLPWNNALNISETLSGFKKDDKGSVTPKNKSDLTQTTSIPSESIMTPQRSLDFKFDSAEKIDTNLATEVQENDSFTGAWPPFSVNESFSETSITDKLNSNGICLDSTSTKKESVDSSNFDNVSTFLVENPTVIDKNEQLVIHHECLEKDPRLAHDFSEKNSEPVSVADFIDQSAPCSDSKPAELYDTLHPLVSSQDSDFSSLSEFNSGAEKALPMAQDIHLISECLQPEDSSINTETLSISSLELENKEVLPHIVQTTSYDGDKKSQKDFVNDYVGVSIDSNQASYDSSSTLSSYDVLNVNSDTEMANSRTNSDLNLVGGHTSSTGSSETSRLDSSIDTVVEQTQLDSLSDTEIAAQEFSFSVLNQDTKEPDLLKDPVMSEDISQSLSSSYVRCMIEEAMEDLSKTEDSGSDNHSNGEKSESSKVDSEVDKSIYSGHESSDDIETTTSSDIEIITAPSSNGENRYSSFDLSPLKIVVQRSGRDQCHSDSQSSSSANSKGELDRLSPERGEILHWREEDFQHQELQSAREESTNNPYHPERLLKLSKLVVQHKVHGGQKLAEMAEVLQARENKLVQLSKDNHQLVEDNNILRSQLQQCEEAQQAEAADLTALTNEFTARLSEAEKKLQSVLKEKEALKQKLIFTEKELEKRSGNSDLQALLNEKQEQIEELLAEGEKLSKQQLQSSNIIKKLRVKEKENDQTVTSQKKKLEELTKDVERLTAVLDSREDVEKKQSDAINQLNAAVQRQDKELYKLKSDLEDSQEKNRGLQSALDNSYKEIAELHKSNATQDSKAQELALSAETHVREELKAAMEREQQKFKVEKEALIIQIDDLRLEMARLEKEHCRREDLLRQEITHLQEGLQQNEARSQDLTQCVSSATRPLLRQIENLQATYGAQLSAWEKVEKTLTDRLADSQTALALAQEKERTASEQLMELSAKVSSLEASNLRLKQEKSQLTAQIESDKSQLEELQDARNKIVTQLEANKQKLVQELNQLKMDKIHLDSQLTLEQTKLETERKKNVALEEQLKLALDIPRSHETPSPTSSLGISRNNSMIGSMNEGHSNSMMHWSFHEDSDSGSTTNVTRTSVYDSLRQSGTAAVVENLSSQLKLREGEIVQLQSEISQLERTRESMARELVNLSNQIDELVEFKEAHNVLQENFNELNGRYNAILQMYGEKEEQVQELKLDLQDIKEMYKTQIDALLAK